MTIKFIFFDWGSTLGKKHTRKRFINHKSPHVKRAQLVPGAITLLRNLRSRGIYLGIISNMSQDRRAMDRALRETGLYNMFDVIVYSSDANMCKKPCRKIFDIAFSFAREQIPSLRNSEILYIGNDYVKDIEPIKKFYPNMSTVLIKTGIEKRCVRNKSDGCLHLQVPTLKSLESLL